MDGWFIGKVLEHGFSLVTSLYLYRSGDSVGQRGASLKYKASFVKRKQIMADVICIGADSFDVKSPAKTCHFDN